MFRTVITSTARPFVSRRAFSTSPVACKTVTEKVSEVADKVNKKVGQGLASAIDKGEHATNAAKETIGATATEAKQDAEHAGRVTGQKAHQAAAGAREAKKDFEKEVKK
ncbi:hypothetical protein BDQ12DRAFT_713757 [Crucibulum laeve]|uniref:Uncharacterized protein n=1 Tax=Crucibulum laeve TaxID=68775 RepID=A0A5C3LWM4_9AGAR|nr:hypothetical protein BDQ12DRAFT_713757 [Crucibulum laeve]